MARPGARGEAARWPRASAVIALISFGDVSFQGACDRARQLTTSLSPARAAPRPWPWRSRPSDRRPGTAFPAPTRPSVTSLGVPKTVTVPRKDMTPNRVAIRSGVARRSASLEAHRGFAIGRRRIGRDLGEQALDDRIGAGVDLLAKDGQNMGAPRGVVHDARAQTCRMQHKAHGVDRRAHEIGRTAFVKLGQSGVRRDDVPMPVNREGGIRLMRLQDGVDCGFRRIQRRKRSFLKRRRESGGEQQRVLIPKRDLEIFGETRDHLAARLRLAGLEAGQVPGRAVCGESKIGLRHAAPLAPAPQQHAERKLMGCHALEQ